MVSKRRRLVSLLLAVMMLISVMTVATVSTSAASGDTVFCENAANWGNVYCYMWKDGAGDNQGWPGVKMTQGDGNLWSYTLSGDWNMIIFNDGGGTQTGNMEYQGHGSCYNNSTQQWSTVDVPDNTTPDTPDTPDTPVTPTPSGKNAVYFKNTANWGKVNVYMWNEGGSEYAKWPGVAATDLGEGIWELQYEGNYGMIIFNDGSTQTGNINHAGTGMMYDYSTSQWEMYDTSKLHIKSLTSDVASPQYTGVKINLAVVAGGGEGELSYKFSAGSTVISDYSSKSSVSWTPAAAGSYTVKAEVKDTLGEVVSKTMSFEIKDIATEVKPVIQSVEATPTNYANNEILKGKEAKINVTAGGGNTGTKLLFYKMTITDAAGETVNVPYYTLKNEYKFTPSAEGKYSFTSTVQGSDNSITARTVEYKSVGTFTEPGELSATVSAKSAGGDKYTITAEAFGGTAPYTYQFAVNGEVKQAFGSAATYTLAASTPGSYNVEITVKDSKGNTAKDSTVVQVAGADTPGTPTTPTTPTTPDSGDSTKPESLALTVTADTLGEGKYKFTANATGGAGSYQYEFVANGYTVVAYSDKNTVSLDMGIDGVYVIKVSVKDAAGAVVSKEMTITVSNGEASIPTEPSEPVDALSADVTFTKNGDDVTITAQGTGGAGEYEYQFSVNGTVYQAYSDKNSFTCSMPYDATYSVEVSVKDKTGTSATQPVEIEIKDGELVLPTEPTDPEETTKPSEPAGEYLKGDADENGKVNIKDATIIQKHVAKILTLSAQGQANADVDENSNINIKDATMIQKFIASLIEW